MNECYRKPYEIKSKIEMEAVLSENDVEFDVTVAEGSEPWQRCGISFNPSKDSAVDHIKMLSAALMQAINDYTGEGPGSQRSMATAKTYLESAQMFAVKGLFVDGR